MTNSRSDAPSQTEGNGRAERGKFGKGNKFGRGNPVTRRQALYRAQAYRACSKEDVARIVAKHIELARDGDMVAIKEFYERFLGKAEALDLAVELEELRELVASMRGSGPRPMNGAQPSSATA